jgi:hypothetical protein
MAVVRPLSRISVLCLALCFLVRPVLFSQLSCAAEISTGEVLEGFEDVPAEETAPEDVDSVLEGFETGSEPAPDSVDEVLSGFESTESADAEETAGFETAPVTLDGRVKLGAAVNFAHDAPPPGRPDWRGVSRLRGELTLELNLDIRPGWEARIGGKAAYDAVYELKGRDEYPEGVLDAHEDEIELRETYLLGRVTDRIDIKLGRQIVVWGKSDNLRVTDVLNPLDVREPGLTDIEDLRLPVAMAKIDYYTGPWNLTALAVPEIRFDKRPGYGHDFYPVPYPLPPESEPSNGGENTEIAAALEGIFSGWDVAFYTARIFNDTPHGEPVGPFQTRLAHARLAMYGAAANLASGNWLIKGEVAHLDGLEFFHARGEAFQRTDVLIGAEYSGFDETMLSVELVDRRLWDFTDSLKQAPDNQTEDALETALRFERTYRNETVTVTGLSLLYGGFGNDGSVHRLSVKYDLSDAVNLFGGVVIYESGDRTGNIGDNDRLYLEAEYSF